ncbi:uncharacterized protein A1O5_00508 [Cladophialophora psammophila CBS 110553]|uniref:BZIP domain-containing protein n=1 Tax=Cladophialophora psammophila CBS 110553 TaxID=1182543 RepID=W9XF79_9EURO|nr:uncharacterized protein A1O5_00508 [Cladophialophora psammophila CBS 110553]EXJ76000.1 hypothetical protein A1O5_00508 [Cladophialophora psammophila CBS 110553]
MESEGSEGSTKINPVISKQQRVRDNQRRSRARRREYIAELEHQLQQCRNTCREADLQRTAFSEVQAENARLRHLLKNAGINPDLLETTLGDSTLHRPGGLTAAAFRELRPKLSIPEAVNPSATGMQNPIGAASCLTPSPSPYCTTPPLVSSGNFPFYDTQYCYELMGSSTAPVTTMSAATAAANPLASTSCEWYFPPQGEKAHVPNDNTFVRQAFLVPSSGPLCADDGNSISCSVAKDMIAQYNPTPEEMDNIVARLSTGFTPPLYPGESCRVNRQVLFQILYELNSNQVPSFATGHIIGSAQSKL